MKLGKIKAYAAAIAMLMWAATAAAQTPNDETVVLTKAQFDELLERIDRLERKQAAADKAVKDSALDATTGATELTANQQGGTADYIGAPKKKKNFFAEADKEPFEQFRFGGYGEILAQYKDYSPNRLDGRGKGAPKQNRGEFSLPRFVLAFDYKFGKGWELSAEIEFEYGGTGTSIEAEYGEGVEYESEIEYGGEVALEQFHITKTFNPAARLRIGHMVVPVGITNAHHEPINFLGTTRPEGESTLIPCTWHETGLAFLGSYKGFNYEFMVVTGLDPYGFGSENWIQDGSQGRIEVSNFANPALAARLEYEAPFGLRVGLSGYYGPRTADNTDRVATTTSYGVNGGVGVATADLQFMAHNVIARANFMYGWIQDAEKINSLPAAAKILGYPNTNVASQVMSYFAEVGVDVTRACGLDYSIIPFVRYEYYNSMYKVASGTAYDPRYNISLITAGINYRPLPNLVIKADYTHRWVDQGNFNSENTVSLAVAYVGWFISK